MYKNKDSDLYLYTWVRNTISQKSNNIIIIVQKKRKENSWNQHYIKYIFLTNTEFNGYLTDNIMVRWFAFYTFLYNNMRRNVFLF